MLNNLKLTLSNWFSKVSKDINMVLVILTGALGLGLYLEKRKKDAADTLLDNFEAKKEIQDIDNSLNKDTSNLETEEEKRKLLDQQLQKEQKDVDDKTLLDFYRNRK